MDDPNLGGNQYRYERKFLVSELTCHEVVLIVKLHPAGFIRQYQPRFVNSLYLDSVNLNNYLDNVNGHKHRVKPRFRWYGNLFGFIRKPVLEIKIKSGLLGTKQVFSLVAFNIDGTFQKDTIRRTLRESDIPNLTRQQLLGAEPTVISRYKRDYYISADHKYRLTIDSEVSFYHFWHQADNLLHHSKDQVNTIIELKYGLDEDAHVDQITNHFPFRMTRSSKYTSGVESLYSW